MDVSINDNGVYVFDGFRLDRARRCLSRNGTKLTLAPRLFDTLLYLVENPGRVVEKYELLHAVWGDRVVEESNVGQTIFALRKALQTDAWAEALIVTAPGRGYRFVASVRLESGVPAAPPMSTTSLPPEPPIAAEMQRPAQARIPRDGALVWTVWLALLTVGFGVLGLLYWSARETVPAIAPAPFTPPPHSVAVLPFTNMSGDPAQDYFSDGLSEELINALSRIDGLRVVARTSAFAFKGKPVTVGQIARQLNVGTVLEGSVRRDGSRVRITAELVNADSGFELWSQSYDRDQQDTLQVQGDITAAVTGALRSTLLSDETTKLTAGGTRDANALDAYLRGKNMLRRFDEASARAAVAAFDEAIRIDQDYADAYAGRAEALRLLENAATSNDVDWNMKTRQQALESANQAVKLAPRSGTAHMVRSDMLAELLDLRGAKSEISQALELNAGSADILRDYASLEGRLGHLDSSIAAAKRALALDPLAGPGYLALAQAYHIARRNDEALAEIRHALVLDQADPTFDIAWLAILHLAQNKPALVLQDCQGEWNLYRSPYCAIAEYRLGHLPAAHAELARLQAALGDNGAFPYAEVYAEMGDRKAALRWLEKDYQLRDGWLSWMKVDFDLDSIHDTPEFKDIERRMDYPP